VLSDDCVDIFDKDDPELSREAAIVRRKKLYVK